ncbi:MAG TPA: hypothetical protein VG815_16940 [Chloroflexota bacterium]|jgi:hypothetical protein|nr:hypothetical protein [Chloroflexota bacterium]
MYDPNRMFMRWIAALSGVFLGIGFAMKSHGETRDLTAEQARSVLASVGINPGTIRQVGDMGRFELLSVDVAKRGRGEFLVRIKIGAVP